jgi:hypothetical protein
MPDADTAVAGLSETVTDTTGLAADAAAGWAASGGCAGIRQPAGDRRRPLVDLRLPTGVIVMMSTREPV